MNKSICKLLFFVKHIILIRLFHNIRNFIIFKFVKKNNVVNLDIGSGSTISFLDDYISTDKHNFNLLDIVQMKTFLKGAKIRNVFSEHVFEHLDEDEMIRAINNLGQFMYIGSRIRIAVPDGYNPSNEYIENVMVGGIGPGANDHKQLLNYDKIKSISKDYLKNFEFEYIEYFDSLGKFHSNEYINIGKEIKRSSSSFYQNKSFYSSHLSLIFDLIKVEK